MKICRSMRIGNRIAKNRIVMPPLVCFNWGDDDGYATVNRREHYEKRARGGVGTIIVEATAISKEGRLSNTQLGLWKDSQIPQFRQITKGCHNHNTVMLLQLVHAGMKATVPVAPSKTVFRDTKVKRLSKKEIKQIKHDFIEASKRAKIAGFDGVEIHNAHGYLLNQFTSSKINMRIDKYGRLLKGRIKLTLEIIKEIKEEIPDFIISVRFGVNDKTFSEDISFIKELENIGVDLLNVSSGFVDEIKVPEEYDHSWISYLGVEIKKHIQIPVVSVGGIKTHDQAKDLLNRVDFVAVGRGLLADYEWVNKAIINTPINTCKHCKPRCRYSDDGKLCPTYK